MGLPPPRRYVFAEFPHGVLPLGPVLAGTAVHKVRARSVCLCVCV